MDTDQLNIRLSKSIIFDLEFVSRAMGISKTDWVRYNLAETLQKDKERFLFQLEVDFINGRKSAAEFKEIAGFLPNASLQARREQQSKKSVELVQNSEHTQFAKKALLDKCY